MLWEKSGYSAGKARWKGHLDRPPGQGKALRLPGDRGPAVLTSQRGPPSCHPCGDTRHVSESSWTFPLGETSEDNTPGKNLW